MAITLNGTTGITTPDVTSDGLTVDSTTLVVDEVNNRVGVGTSSPNDRLDIGSGRLSASSDTTTPTGGSAYFYKQSTGATVSGYQVILETGSAGSRAERARIDSSGCLLVKTTTKLIGNETAKFSSTGSSSNTLVLTHDSADDRAMLIMLHAGSSGGTSRKHAAFLDGNGFERGSISVNGSSTSYNTSSDYRLKEDWVAVADASTRVNALKPVNFAWKSTGTRVDGFLAHELAEVVPEAVHGEKDAVDAEGKPAYQGIDQSKLVPLLTAALQEALAEIETLKARVSALEATNV